MCSYGRAFLLTNLEVQIPLDIEGTLKYLRLIMQICQT